MSELEITLDGPFCKWLRRWAPNAKMHNGLIHHGHSNICALITASVSAAFWCLSILGFLSFIGLGVGIQIYHLIEFGSFMRVVNAEELSIFESLAIAGLAVLCFVMAAAIVAAGVAILGEISAWKHSGNETWRLFKAAISSKVNRVCFLVLAK